MFDQGPTSIIKYLVNITEISDDTSITSDQYRTILGQYLTNEWPLHYVITVLLLGLVLLLLPPPPPLLLVVVFVVVFTGLYFWSKCVVNVSETIENLRLNSILTIYIFPICLLQKDNTSFWQCWRSKFEYKKNPVFKLMAVLILILLRVDFLSILLEHTLAITLPWAIS